MTHFRSYAGAALTAVALLVTTLAAQPPRPDPIEAAKTQQKLADQKATSVVEAAVQDADRAFKNGTAAKAAQILKTAKNDIDLAVGISGDARKNLTANLTARLAAVQGRPAPAATPGVKLDPKADE